MPCSPGAKTVSARAIAAGAFKTAPSPIAPDLAQRVATMPAFCRVQAVATSTPDSRIGVKVWLPLQRWNGRLLGTGNGGGAGRIAYEMGMVEALKRGFAVANTDMGTAPDTNATLDRSPEAKVSAGQWSSVSRPVRAHFVGKDGGAPADAFLTDPRQCRFDPATLPVCKAGAAAVDCLTAPQLATLRRLYAGQPTCARVNAFMPGSPLAARTGPLGPIMQGDPATWPDQQFYRFRWALGSTFAADRFDYDR